VEGRGRAGQDRYPRRAAPGAGLARRRRALPAGRRVRAGLRLRPAPGRRRQVPRSAAGFTGPRWRGRVISTYPHQDDVTLYLYSVLADRHGWPFIDQLLASSPQFVNGHLGVAQGLAAGTAALSFDHIISLGAADRRAGRLAVTIPADDPMPVWPQNAAILDRSPSPAAARLFLRWLLEPDQQNAFAQGGGWSPRLDIAPPPGLPPLADLNIANRYPAFITRTALAQAYRDRFAALIGPVTGPEYRRARRPAPAPRPPPRRGCSAVIGIDTHRDAHEVEIADAAGKPITVLRIGNDSGGFAGCRSGRFRLMLPGGTYQLTRVQPADELGQNGVHRGTHVLVRAGMQITGVEVACSIP
jgi:Bacterial extracellular solute-binding protein